jgi:hypothetical protein
MAAVWLTGARRLFAATARNGPCTDHCPSVSRLARLTKPPTESEKPFPWCAAPGIGRNSRRVLIVRMSGGASLGVTVHRE